MAIANGYEIAGRTQKVMRIVDAMDMHAGHPVTADEALAFTDQDWLTILARADRTAKAAGIKRARRPSDETSKALAEWLVARDDRRATTPKDPWENF